MVTLHCPLAAETEGLVNRDRLALMKKSAFLINTSRGPVVDEEALAAALNEDRLAGAGLDVLSTEPPEPNNPLLAARNCWITPHIAWATRASRQRLLTAVAANIRAFLEGRPKNVVSFKFVQWFRTEVSSRRFRCTIFAGRRGCWAAFRHTSY